MCGAPCALRLLPPFLPHCTANHVHPCILIRLNLAVTFPGCPSHVVLFRQHTHATWHSLCRPTLSCSGYISRSVAGSFDNEAVAIFALVLTFYLWVRAVNRGTVASGVACALAYLYMAASW